MKNQVVYSCLYHDMKQRVMVQLVLNEDEAIEQAFETFDELMDNDTVKSSGIESEYTYRLVTDINSLREKASILNDKLDDRAIELVKLIASIQCADDDEFFSEAVPYYFRMDEHSGLVLNFVGDESVVAVSVNREAYDSFVELVRDREPEDKGLRFVDREWAYEFFAANPSC
jgi:hypothetical protein